MFQQKGEVQILPDLLHRSSQSALGQRIQPSKELHYAAHFSSVCEVLLTVWLLFFKHWHELPSGVSSSNHLFPGEAGVM